MRRLGGLAVLAGVIALALYRCRPTPRQEANPEAVVVEEAAEEAAAVVAVLPHRRR